MLRQMVIGEQRRIIKKIVKGETIVMMTVILLGSMNESINQPNERHQQPVNERIERYHIGVSVKLNGNEWHESNGFDMGSLSSNELNGVIRMNRTARQHE